MAGVPTDLFDCARVSSYLEAYLLDRVPPPERRGMRLHIHRCPACFAKVTARDPLQLFAPLADQQRGGQGAGEEAWGGFWDGIAEGIRKDESLDAPARLARWIQTRPGLLTAAAAALIAALGLVLLLQPATPPQPEPGSLPIVATGAAPAEEPLPPVVEAVRTPDARPVTVYTMSYEVPGDLRARAGGAPEEGAGVAQLVLIVDGGLEL